MAIHLEIENLAAKYGFVQEDWDENSKRVTFKNEKHQIDIYLTKMTVGHKRLGETSQFLYRKNLTINQIEDYFIELTGHNMREDSPLEYWKKRAEIAEAFIEQQTHALDRPEEFHARKRWEDFKSKKIPS